MKKTQIQVFTGRQRLAFARQLRWG